MSTSLMSMASESSVANDENDEHRVKPTGGQRSRPGVRWAQEGGGVEGRLLEADAGGVGSGRLEREEGVVGCDGQGSEAAARGAEAAEGAEPEGKGVEGETKEDGVENGDESDGEGTCGAEGRTGRR